MKPLSVTISGFRAFGKGPTTIEFPSGVIALTGDNEVGKTSLIESIMWALYGAPAMREKQEGLIHEGLKDMSVTFEFEIDGSPIKVTRRYTLAGKITLTLEVPGADVTQATIKETAASIETLVGPYEVASRSWYSPQERGKLFFEANPAERRDVFGQTLAIPETWATWHSEARDKFQSYKGEADVSDLILENMGEPDRTPDEIQGNIESKSDERDLIKVSIETWEGNLEDGRKALSILMDADALRDAVITQLFSDAMETWATEASAIDERNDAGAAEVAEKQTAIRNKWNIAYDTARGKNLAARATVTEQTTAETDMGNWSALMTSVGNEMEGLDPDSAECPTCHQFVVTDEAKEAVATKRAGLQAEIDSIDEKMKESIWNPDTLDAAKVEAEKGLPHMEELDLYENEEKPPQPTREQFVEHEDVPALSDADEITKVTDGVTKCRTKLFELNASHLTVGHVITNLERDKTDAEALITNRADTITARDAHAEEARHWEVVYSLTGPTGVRQLMIDQAISGVQATANEMLEILQPGTQIFFDTQTETGRETLDILLSAPDGVRTVASRSGGAGSRIATAIRISLAIEAAKSHGMPTLPFFVLDEVFDSNDAEGKASIVRLLHWLADRVDVVLVVSHDGELLESFDSQIHLTKPAGETILS